MMNQKFNVISNLMSVVSDNHIFRNSHDWSKILSFKITIYTFVKDIIYNSYLMTNIDTKTASFLYIIFVCQQNVDMQKSEFAF